MANRIHTRWTPQARAAFLAALRSGKTVAQAATLTGLSRETAYRLRRRNARFARAWALALDIAQDDRLARLAADRRPREPFMREAAVVYQGDIVGYRQSLDTARLLRTLTRLDRQVAVQDLCPTFAPSNPQNSVTLAAPSRKPM